MNQINDIDNKNKHNTIYVTEYVNDIYNDLFEREKEVIIKPYFDKQKEIKPKMRSILIDWLVDVHLKFRLKIETLYLTVYILDKFSEKNNIYKKDYQLVGLTAMNIACKMEEKYAPLISDFSWASNYSCSIKKIIATERIILNSLDFDLLVPSKINFLKRFSQVAKSNLRDYNLSKYILESTLIDIKFNNYKPSKLVAAIIMLTHILLNKPRWNQTLEKYTTYNKDTLKPLTRKIYESLVRKRSIYKTITQKYTAKKFNKVASIKVTNKSIII